MNVFMSYYHSSSVLGWFTTTIRPLTCLRILTKNSSISRIMAVFMTNCPQFWGSRGIYNDHKTRYMFERYDQKPILFALLWLFSWDIADHFGVSGRFTTTVRLDIHLRDLIKTHPFRALWPFSWAIAHGFGVLERFSTIVRPDTCLRDMTKNSLYSRFMAVFMSYYPQYWVSRAIYNESKTR